MLKTSCHLRHIPLYVYSPCTEVAYAALRLASPGKVGQSCAPLGAARTKPAGARLGDNPLNPVKCRGTKGNWCHYHACIKSNVNEHHAKMHTLVCGPLWCLIPFAVDSFFLFHVSDGAILSHYFTQ